MFYGQLTGYAINTKLGRRTRCSSSAAGV